MQGTLADFALAEILQLVALQTKTGLLIVQNQKQLLTLYFDNGILVSCRDRRQLAQDPLFHFMKSSGYLTKKNATYIENELKTSKKDLAELLIGQGYVAQEELGYVLEDVAQEVIYRSYSWNRGNYRFIAGSESLDGLQYKIAGKVEGLLMEAARRTDEWSRFKETLPDPQLILDKVVEMPPDLDEGSLALLSLLRVPMTLETLLGQSRRHEFDVYEILIRGIENGVVRVLEIPKPSAPSSFRETGSTKQFRIESPSGPDHRLAAAWIFAALVFASSLWAATMISFRLRDEEKQTHMQLIETPQLQAELRHQIELYRALFGAYPVTLELLADSDLCDPALVGRCTVERYVRYADGLHYLLLFSDPIQPVDRPH